jgi:hypothetical protein
MTAMTTFQEAEAAFRAAFEAVKAASDVDKPALTKLLVAAYKVLEPLRPPPLVPNLPLIPVGNGKPMGDGRYVTHRTMIKKQLNETPSELAFRLAVNARFIAEDLGGTEEEIDAAHAACVVAQHNLWISRRK